jgi:hypothetical protein
MLHGLDVYITEPQTKPVSQTGLIVVLSDAFGWNTINLRGVADRYAERTGCKVYLPDFMHGELIFDSLFLFPQNFKANVVSGTSAPATIKSVIDRVLTEKGFWGWLVKP